MTRIAILDKERCINKNGCNFVCGNMCPVNRAGKECIVLEEGKIIPTINESLCIGFNICVAKCPAKCIKIENMVQELNEPATHRFGKNSFRIYRLPFVRKGEIVGLIGKNGIGKSTILKILAGQLLPNLGDYESKASFEKILKYFKGKEFFNYFSALETGGIKVAFKPQAITDIPKAFKGKVIDLLSKVDERNKLSEISKLLSIEKILDRNISELSGGELQRVAIAATGLRDVDFYAFDEPSSFLDIKERFSMASLLRSLVSENKSVIVIEHDLAVLDYLSEYIHILYGKHSVYGIVSNPKSVKNGINEFLSGFVKDENTRFRSKEIKFSVNPSADYKKKNVIFKYPALKKTLGSFSLDVEAGDLREAEVLGIMGANAIGKTTFVKMLAGVEKPDSNKVDFNFKVSYKPQYISPEKGVTVSDFLSSQELDKSVFKNEVDRRLDISSLEDHLLSELSGGELQKVAVGTCLSRANSDLILLDEPTAFVDVEDRINLADTVRSVIDSRKKIAMVVDHDIIFQDYVSDRMIVFTGEPSLKGYAGKAVSMHEGMNVFLKEMKITFRRDHESGRPRANKLNSQLDKSQKKSGEYYYVVD